MTKSPSFILFTLFTLAILLLLDIVNAQPVSVDAHPVSACVSTPHRVYLPVVVGPADVPGVPAAYAPTVLVGRPNSVNEWQITISSSMATNELQESHDVSFESPTSIMVVDGVHSATHTPSIENVYYYRARGICPEGGKTAWSEVVSVTGAYHDDFSTSADDWQVRRVDRDGHRLELGVTDEQYLRFNIASRYDSALISPLASMPEPPYRIDTEIVLNQRNREQAFGIAFGGDWNGLPCPNGGRIYDDNCMNAYYLVEYKNGASLGGYERGLDLRVQRIDTHDGNNKPQGVDILPYTFTVFGNDNWTLNYFHKHSIKVEADGTITVFLDDREVFEFQDETYIERPYFGVYVETEDYPHADISLKYFSVTPLD